MKVKSESEVAQSGPTLATPWTAAYQAPPSKGFSRQEYWSGLPLPSPREEVPDVKRIQKEPLVQCVGRSYQERLLEKIMINELR